MKQSPRRPGAQPDNARSAKSLSWWFLTLTATGLAVEAVRFVFIHQDHWVYLPAYLIFIYLCHHSWARVIVDPVHREHLYIGLGLAIAILRYHLIFSPLEPYTDVFTVATFYFFAYSQTLVLQKSKRLKLGLTGIFLASLIVFLSLIGSYHLQWPFQLTKEIIENHIGPIWLLASLGSLILVLLGIHIRAAIEFDDFVIRLRLGFLILTWLLFTGFFLLDEGVHFGWFSPSKHLSDIILVAPIVCVALGLAMPQRVERFFIGLNFLDRRTSRELTLFVLSRIIKRSSCSPLTELALATADRLGMSRQNRSLVFLACELLEADYQESMGITAGDSTWEELIVSSKPERRRLAAEHHLVFKAWRLKRAVEKGTIKTYLPAAVIAAARDYLTGAGLAAYDNQLRAAVRGAAEELLSTVEEAATGMAVDTLN